jgi:hypothetical protein
MAASVIMTVVSVVAAICARILADELKAWRPWLTRRLIAFAARRVPTEQQDRYEEEWASYVEEITGEVGRVLAAVGLLRAAIQIGIVSRRDSRKRMNATGEGRAQRRVVVAELLHRFSRVFLRFEVWIFTISFTFELGILIWIFQRHHWSLQEIRQSASLPAAVIAFVVLVAGANQLWVAWRQRRARAAAYGAILLRLSRAARLAVEINAKFQELIPQPEMPESSGQSEP